MAITRLGGANAISGAITSSNFPTGSVLQVVNKYIANQDGQLSTTSTSFTASGISQAITPTVVGSLLIINYSCSMADANGNSAVMHSKMYYKTGSGAFASMPSASNFHMGYVNVGHNRYSPQINSSSITTTTTDTYTFQPYFKSNNGNEVRFAHDGSSIGMTIFEVKQ